MYKNRITILFWALIFMTILYVAHAPVWGLAGFGMLYILLVSINIKLTG